MAVIIVQKVSKVYRINYGPYGTFRDDVANFFGRFLRNGNRMSSDKKDHKLWALKNINFQVEQGEALGIIGPNGAGKTTMLKLLARVTIPTDGNVSIHGKVAPLIELGAGFHPELTGRQNIFLNGSIMGMRKKEIEQKIDSIADFAGLESYLDMPVKKYSSGMYARLGFSIAIHTNPDILLIDEVLAVGDFAFQQRCLRRMKEFKQRGVTIIFVSHNLDMVRYLCDNTILLYEGRVIDKGPTANTLNNYYKICSESILCRDESDNKKATIVETELFNSKGDESRSFHSGETAKFYLKAFFNEDVERVVLGFFIKGTDKYLINSTPSNELGFPPRNFRKGDKIEIEVEFTVNLISGIYHIGTQITNADFTEFYDLIESAIVISVYDKYSHGGVADIKPHYKIRKSEL